MSIRRVKKPVIFLLIIAFLTAVLAENLIPLKTAHADVLSCPINFILNKFHPKLETNPQSFALLKGIEIDPKNPFQLQFYVDSMDKKSVAQDEINRFIRYFLGFLAMPKDKLWVNLSPYEKDRIIPEELSNLDIGKDFLLEDYLLKQLTSSLTNPKTVHGKKFWQGIYQAAQRIAQTTKVPIDNFYPHKADFTKCVINVFNKVWIVPDIAEIYEHSVGAGSKPALNKQNKTIAFVKKARLRVMLEEDCHNNVGKQGKGLNSPVPNRYNLRVRDTTSVKIQELNNQAKEIFRKDLLPIIEEQVNNSSQFMRLRQMLYALVLAKYFKEKFLKHYIYQHYIDQEKMTPIKQDLPQLKEKVYQAYLKNFKNGVYDVISGKESRGARRYFSGGLVFGDVSFKSIPLEKTFVYASDRTKVGVEYVRNYFKGKGKVKVKVELSNKIEHFHSGVLIVILQSIIKRLVGWYHRWAEYRKAIKQDKELIAEDLKELVKWDLEGEELFVLERLNRKKPVSKHLPIVIQREDSEADEMSIGLAIDGLILQGQWPQGGRNALLELTQGFSRFQIENLIFLVNQGIFSNNNIEMFKGKRQLDNFKELLKYADLKSIFKAVQEKKISGFVWDLEFLLRFPWKCRNDDFLIVPEKITHKFITVLSILNRNEYSFLLDLDSIFDPAKGGHLARQAKALLKPLKSQLSRLFLDNLLDGPAQDVSDGSLKRDSNLIVYMLSILLLLRQQFNFLNKEQYFNILAKIIFKVEIIDSLDNMFADFRVGAQDLCEELPTMGIFLGRMAHEIMHNVFDYKGMYTFMEKFKHRDLAKQYVVFSEFVSELADYSFSESMGWLEEFRNYYYIRFATANATIKSKDYQQNKRMLQLGAEQHLVAYQQLFWLEQGVFSAKRALNWGVLLESFLEAVDFAKESGNKDFDSIVRGMLSIYKDKINFAKESSPAIFRYRGFEKVKNWAALSRLRFQWHWYKLKDLKDRLVPPWEVKSLLRYRSLGIFSLLRPFILTVLFFVTGCMLEMPEVNSAMYFSEKITFTKEIGMKSDVSLKEDKLKATVTKIIHVLISKKILPDTKYRVNYINHDTSLMSCSFSPPDKYNVSITHFIMDKLPEKVILLGVLHELGHIAKGHNLLGETTIKQQQQQEDQADHFALEATYLLEEFFDKHEIKDLFTELFTSLDPLMREAVSTGVIKDRDEKANLEHPLDQERLDKIKQEIIKLNQKSRGAKTNSFQSQPMKFNSFFTLSSAVFSLDFLSTLTRVFVRIPILGRYLFPLEWSFMFLQNARENNYLCEKLKGAFNFLINQKNIPSEIILELVVENNKMIDYEVLSWLIQLGNQAVKAAPVLISKLGDDFMLNRGIVHALFAMGKEVIPQLCEALDNAQGDVKLWIVSVLSEFGPEAADAVPYLVKEFNESESHEKVQLKIVECLGEIGPAARLAMPIFISRFCWEKVYRDSLEKVSSPFIREFISLLMGQNSYELRNKMVDFLITAPWKNGEPSEVFAETLSLIQDQDEQNLLGEILNKLSSRSVEIFYLVKKLYNSRNHLSLKPLFMKILAFSAPNPEEGFPLLMAILTEQKENVHPSVIYKLGSMKEIAKPAIPLLFNIMPLLKGSSKLGVISALINIGIEQEKVLELFREFFRCEEDFYYPAIEILSNITGMDKVVFTLLTELLDKKSLDFNILMHAQRVLDKIDFTQEDNLGCLLSVIEQGGKHSASWAIEKLIELNLPDEIVLNVFKALLEKRGSLDSAIYPVLLNAIYKLGPKAVSLSPLVVDLFDVCLGGIFPDSLFVRRTLIAIDPTGKLIFPCFLEKFSNLSAPGQIELARTISQFEESDPSIILPVVIRLLELIIDRDTRDYLLTALEKIGQNASAAVPTLLKLVKVFNDRVDKYKIYSTLIAIAPEDNRVIEILVDSLLTVKAGDPFYHDLENIFTKMGILPKIVWEVFCGQGRFRQVCGNILAALEATSALVSTAKDKRDRNLLINFLSIRKEYSERALFKDVLRGVVSIADLEVRQELIDKLIIPQIKMRVSGITLVDVLEMHQEAFKKYREELGKIWLNNELLCEVLMGRLALIEILDMVCADSFHCAAYLDKCELLRDLFSLGAALTDFVEGVYYQGMIVDVYSFLDLLNRDCRFQIPMFKQDYLDSLKSYLMQKRAGSFSQKNYIVEPKQRDLCSYQLTENFTIEQMLNATHFSGNLVIHQTKNLDFLKMILFSGYIIPASLYDRLNEENYFKKMLMEGRAHSLISTEFVHFSVNSVISYLKSNVALVYPVELMLENQAYMLDPLKVKDWAVGGFSRDAADLSNRIPVKNAIVLVPEGEKDNLEQAFMEIEKKFLNWERPKRIFYYNGNTVEEGLAQLKSFRQNEIKKISISQLPQSIGLSDQQGFKCDDIGAHAAALLAVKDVHLLRYEEDLPYLVRLEEVKAFSTDIENIVKDVLKINNLSFSVVKDTGSSKRGTYQERYQHFPDDFDLMIQLNQTVLPGDSELLTISRQVADQIKNRNLLSSVYPEDNIELRVSGMVKFVNSRRLVTISIFREGQDIPVSAIDLVFFNTEELADGVRYQKAFIGQMNVILSKLSMGREEGEQFILRTIRTLKALCKNRGVYKRYEGGLRGVGIEQLVLQLNNSLPVDSLDELKKIFSVDNVLKFLKNSVFDEKTYLGIEQVRERLPLWDPAQDGFRQYSLTSVDSGLNESGVGRLMDLVVWREEEQAFIRQREEVMRYFKEALDLLGEQPKIKQIVRFLYALKQRVDLGCEENFVEGLIERFLGNIGVVNEDFVARVAKIFLSDRRIGNRAVFKSFTPVLAAVPGLFAVKKNREAGQEFTKGGVDFNEDSLVINKKQVETPLSLFNPTLENYGQPMEKVPFNLDPFDGFSFQVLEVENLS